MIGMKAKSYYRQLRIQRALVNDILVAYSRTTMQYHINEETNIQKINNVIKNFISDNISKIMNIIADIIFN